MTALIYISLSVFFFLVSVTLVISRIFYLSKYPEKYNISYNGHEKFLDYFYRVIRFSIKRFYSVIKVLYQNILHVWVRLISRLTSLTEKIYTKSRNKFVDEVVKDRKAVPHFWSHLKKYKREIDEEKEEAIDNISATSIEEK